MAKQSLLAKKRPIRSHQGSTAAPAVWHSHKKPHHPLTISVYYSETRKDSQSRFRRSNSMRRKIYDDQKHAQFVTFSCYKRRTLLNPDQSKRIVIGTLGSQLAGQDGICLGFVVMPDHVHALIWFTETGQLSSFMNKWKELTSKAIKKLYRVKFPNYWKKLDEEDPVWQPKYHSFNVFSEKKIEEKLDYMHLNPVRAGLVERAVDWTWSSARWYLQGKQVGVPISMPSGII